MTTSYNQQYVKFAGKSRKDIIKRVKNESTHFVYILECKDKTLYVGSTNDLERRLYQHNNLKSGAHYTKIRRPVVLKYSEKVSSFSEARRREAEIKRLSRVEKISLLS